MLPATDWKEVIPEGEAALHERLAETLREIQRKAARGGKAARGLHAKGQAGLEAELTVLPELPEHARVGIFAAPGTFRAFVRVSNGASYRQSDKKPDVRGLAVKIVGVPGKKLIPGMEDAATHDLLVIRDDHTPFVTAEEFIFFVAAAANPLTLLPKVLARFGLRTFAILRALLSGMSNPITSVATTRYFSALPSRFGPYAVKWSLDPHAKAEPGAKALTGKNAIGAELGERLKNGPLTWDLRVQFFRDEKTTPIEDASRAWNEADAPWLTVARLTIPRQDPSSPRGKKLAEFVESLSFDPWHAPVEFRPLGDMMRARNAAYRLSTMERGAAKEPDGSERFEDAA